MKLAVCLHTSQLSHFLLLLPVLHSQIIQRRKRSEMQTEYDFVWPQPQSLIQPSELPSPSQPQASSQGPQDPLKTSYSLWVSPCLHSNCKNNNKNNKCQPYPVKSKQKCPVVSAGVNPPEAFALLSCTMCFKEGRFGVLTSFHSTSSIMFLCLCSGMCSSGWTGHRLCVFARFKKTQECCVWLKITVTF